MASYRYGKYRIRKELRGYVIEKRRGLLFWYEVGFQHTFHRAMKIVENFLKK